jgi:hypothetical protein
MTRGGPSRETLVRAVAALIVAAVAANACGGKTASGDSSESSPSYGLCHGEPGACSQATLHGTGTVIDHCLCNIYCMTDADCPVPTTGSAKPMCTPFGDVVENGHTASCLLPCDATHTCPQGMECYNAECWAPIPH